MFSFVGIDKLLFSMEFAVSLVNLAQQLLETFYFSLKYLKDLALFVIGK